MPRWDRSMGRESHVYGVSVSFVCDYSFGLVMREAAAGLWQIGHANRSCLWYSLLSIYWGSSCRMALRSNLPGGVDGSSRGKLPPSVCELPDSTFTNFFFSWSGS